MWIGDAQAGGVSDGPGLEWVSTLMWTVFRCCIEVRWWMELDGANSRESLVDAHPQLPRGELQLAPLSPEAQTSLPSDPYVAVVRRILYISIFDRTLFLFLLPQFLTSPSKEQSHTATPAYCLHGTAAINIERSEHQ